VRPENHEDIQRLREAWQLLKRASVRFTTLLLAFSISGCVGSLNDLNATGRDGSASSPDLAGGGGDPPDLTSGMDPGDGGLPQSVHFNPDIEMDIELKGCTAVACHGGTQIPVLKNGDLANNYTNFSALANMGVNSPVLAHLLPGATPAHGGGALFTGTSDPVYVRWLAWINAGDPQ
jgi:hypothetical protein